jgi:uncharacterized protein involved in cysteine biosynthesis
MLQAIARAIDQLFTGSILKLLGYCVALSVLCLGAAWFGIGWLLTQTTLFETGWLESTGDLLGWALTLVLSWFLFPMLATVFVGLFLEPVANAVERRHYPGLPPAPGLPLLTGLGASLRFLALVLLLNAALLPTLLFAPLYPIAFVLVNGLLLGREYSDLVAMRRVAPRTAKALRQRHGAEILALGIGTALLNMVPLANFVAPVLVTMVFVHRFEAWRK